MSIQESIQIYGLVEADTLELRYVGQTKNPQRREKRHFYTWPQLTYIVLEQESADPTDAETAWIVYASAEGARLFNQRWHGFTSGRLGQKCSEDDKRKKSIALKGRPKSPEHIEAVNQARRNSSNPIGRASWSPETRKRVAQKAANIRWGNI